MEKQGATTELLQSLEFNDAVGIILLPDGYSRQWSDACFDTWSRRNMETFSRELSLLTGVYQWPENSNIVSDAAICTLPEVYVEQIVM